MLDLGYNKYAGVKFQLGLGGKRLYLHDYSRLPYRSYILVDGVDWSISRQLRVCQPNPSMNFFKVFITTFNSETFTDHLEYFTVNLDFMKKDNLEPAELGFDEAK